VFGAEMKEGEGDSYLRSQFLNLPLQAGLHPGELPYLDLEGPHQAW